MATNNNVRARIVIEDFEPLKEPAPDDAIPVGLVEHNVGGEWKRILKTLLNVDGEEVHQQVVAKFWIRPLP